MAKKRFFTNHAKSSAMVVSLAIHAVLIVVALSFVAVKVIVKEEKVFEAKRVRRPKAPLKKLKVPVDMKKKKAPKPKLRKRIVSKNKSFTDIKMPEITGVKGGLGNMGGDSLGSMGFDLGKMDLFGSNKSMGNELAGTFFDLKQTKDGKPTRIAALYAQGKQMDAHNLYIAEVANFAKGWKTSNFRDYFKAPQEKYASFFMIPGMDANAAPKAFGVDNVVKPMHWVAYYKGFISPPETGRYRFCGYADDILLVRVRNRLILDASHHVWTGKVTNWQSDDENNRKYPLTGGMVIGDWIQLTKGKPAEIEILLGECPGGVFACQLLIEQKGKEYKQVPFKEGTRPVLPVFKTKEIPAKMHVEMKVNPNEATLKGPSFGVVE